MGADTARDGVLGFFTRHPTAANLLLLGLLAFGALNAGKLKRETLPELPLDQVTASVVYRGASPEDVARSVCTRVEDAVDAVADLDELRCEALFGRAAITLEMRAGGDIARFLDDVKTELEAIDDFPAEAEPPVIRIAGRNDFVAAIAVSGPMDDLDLERYAEDLKQRLREDPGVSEVLVEGFADRQVRITVREAELAAHGVTLADVAAAVSRQSVTRPVGEVDGDDTTWLLRLTEERRAPREFESLLVIGARSGAEVPLGRIARIRAVFENDEDRFELDGRRAGLVKVFKQRDADTIDAVTHIEQFVAAERAAAPPGVELAITQDVSSAVRDRLGMLVRNGWQGIVLVGLVLWLMFGARFGFWVAMGLPASFAGALGLMAVLGLSLNMLTMVGLLISIGLLMDDSLVIAENIAARHRAGLPPLAAAIEGTREVLPGVALSYATTVGVFGALAFIGGDIGVMLRWVPIVLIMVLSVSLAEAFVILPNHMAHSVGRGGSGRLTARMETAMAWAAENVAGRFADTCIRFRYLALGLTVLAFLASVAALAGGLLKFQAFPDLEGDVVEARILLPEGTPFRRTQAVVERVVAAARSVGEELGRTESDGAPLVRHVSVQYARNVDAFVTGPHVATVTVDLKPGEQRDASALAFLARWRETTGLVPDTELLKFADFQIGAAGRPIELRLSGPPLADIEAAADELVAWLDGYDGIDDVAHDLRPGRPELRLRLRDGALAEGLDAGQLADQLAAAFLGRAADEVQVDGRTVEIDLRLDAADRDSRTDFEDTRVRLPDGRLVPLLTVARIEEGRGWARIHRIDGHPTATVTAEIDRGRANAAEVVAHTMSSFVPALRERHPGLRVTVEGEQSSGAETQADVQRSLLTGVVVVFLLLCFQFRSYTLPPLVLMLIPCGLIGVVWGHVLLGYDLSMPSMVGFVSLAGVAVNNAILMVEFIGHGLDRGMQVEAAAGEASRRRFRAMLLTTTTTVLGLLPLLTETSVQAQILQPLVVSLVFGLLAATVLVLAVVPALVAVLHDLGWQPRRPAAREPSTA